MKDEQDYPLIGNTYYIKQPDGHFICYDKWLGICWYI